MKIKSLFLIVSINISSYAQNPEFKLYDNGLIYSESSVNKLKHIVDSLNLKFKVCDITKVFFSKNQAKANYLRLEKSKVLEAKKDIENNISYAEFKKKYSKAFYDENLVVIKSVYLDYDKKKVVNYSNSELGKSSGHSLIFNDDELEKQNSKLNGKWIFKYEKKTKFSDEGIEAFYWVEDFESKPLPQKYSRLIQYSECLVDTTAQVFYDNAKYSGVRFIDSLPSKTRLFVEYINKKTNKPEFDHEAYSKYLDSDKEEDRKVFDNEYDKFHLKLKEWDSLRIAKVDLLKENDDQFKILLKEAIEEAKSKKGSNDDFEGYVGKYVSKELELELKRNRRVMGGCSQDNSPRIHAMNIALLSAETTKWEIFLRSHLDIMNDRFDRMSDGSYAWEGRNTYIRELEVLDINVFDLILGISLRIENPVKNHYFGSISRTGRALSESKNTGHVTTTLLEMISDNDLDDYNRILMFYLFDNYNFNLKEESVKKQNQLKLKVAISKMPDYISSRILMN